MNIKTKDFKAALSRVVSLATGRTTMPVLNCVRLEAKDGTLEIAASNLDVFATAKAVCDTEVLEAVCVPAAPLAGLVDSAADGIAMLVKDGRLEFISNGRAILGVIDAKNFQSFPDEPVSVLDLPLADVADGIEACKWAAASERGFDTSDTWMKGVWVTCKDKEMTCAASERKKVAVFRHPISPVPDCNFQIPSHGIDFIVEALREKDCVMAIGEKHISCKWPNGSVFVRQFEKSEHPDWNILLKSDRKDIGEVDLSRLRTAFDTMKMLANGDIFPSSLCSSGLGGITVEFAGKSNQFHAVIPGVYQEARFLTDVEKTIEALAHTPKNMPAKVSVTDNALFLESGEYTAILGLFAQK